MNKAEESMTRETAGMGEKKIVDDFVEEQPLERSSLAVKHEIQEAERELAGLTRPDEARPGVLFRMVGLLTEYARLQTPVSENDLIRAFELAVQTCESSSPDHEWHMSALFAQSTVASILYKTTGSHEWILRGEESGEQTRKLLLEQRDTYSLEAFSEWYGICCENLADWIKLRFENAEIGGSCKQLESAIKCIGRVCNVTEGEDDQVVEDGATPRRFVKWCQWQVLLWDRKEGMEIEPAIEMARSKPHDLDSGNDAEASAAYGLNLLSLLAHKWSKSRRREHLDDLITEARGQWPRLEQPEKYRDNVENADHILRAYLYTFLAELADGLQEKRVTTVETGISICEEILDRVGQWETWGDVEKAHSMVRILAQLYPSRYEISKVAEHGWMVDDVNMMSAGVELVLKGMPEEQPDAEIDFPERNVSYGTSAVTKKDFVVFEGPKLDDWGLRKKRYVFTSSRETLKVGNWIKGYKDDGTWDTSAPVEGVDDDIISFMTGWNSRHESKAAECKTA